MILVFQQIFAEIHNTLYDKEKLYHNSLNYDTIPNIFSFLNWRDFAGWYFSGPGRYLRLGENGVDCAFLVTLEAGG